jgi:hypothetical protein
VSAAVRISARRPVTRVLGSLGVAAAAAAVAGMGTFGSFTDSTAPLSSKVDTGTVSIDLAAPAHTLTFPHVDSGWVPGDHAVMALDLVNTGTSPLASVTLDVKAPQSSALDTDTAHGLQLTIDGCDKPWETSTGAYTCTGIVTHHYAGPVVLSQNLPQAASLAAGGVDHLLATVVLPQDAGNQFMGAQTTLSYLFTGTQRTGTAR